MLHTGARAVRDEHRATTGPLASHAVEIEAGPFGSSTVRLMRG